MKTRTLLLLALGCGVAIMLAGAAFFIQLATQDEIEPPLPVGGTAIVGDMEVTVISSEESNGVLSVTVDIGGTTDDDPADEFRLIASARPIDLARSTCAASNGAQQSCTVDFRVGDVDGESRVLFYERGDDRARWLLA